jgi:hypothetical protein
MNEYLVEMMLPELLTEDFLMKIPEHRMIINKYMSEGIITSYALAEDRSKIWATINADSELELMNIINSFPLRNSLKVHTFPLAFYNRMHLARPQFSLN